MAPKAAAERGRHEGGLRAAGWKNHMILMPPSLMDFVKMLALRDKVNPSEVIARAVSAHVRQEWQAMVAPALGKKPEDVTAADFIAELNRHMPGISEEHRPGAKTSDMMEHLMQRKRGRAKK